MLDVGAGAGAGEGKDLDLVKAQLGDSARYIVIESWKPNVELLQAKGIEVVTSNIENEPIPSPDCSVDLIIANQILEHTKELLFIEHNFSSRLKCGE